MRSGRGASIWRDGLLLALLGLVFVAPLVVLAGYALSPGWRFPDPLPTSLNLRAFAFVQRHGGEIARALAGSLSYSLAAAGLSFILCLAPARVFAWQRFRGKHLLEALLLAPALVPAMTFSMGVHYLFLRLGLADTWPGVVLALTSFSYPYMLRALVAGFQAMGPGWGNCAANLGAGPWTRLVRVELPLLLPAALAGGTVVFLVAFSEYFLVFLIGGGAVPFYAGYSFAYLASSDRAVAAMLTLIFLAVPMLLFVLLEAGVRRRYRRMGMA